MEYWSQGSILKIPKALLLKGSNNEVQKQIQRIEGDGGKEEDRSRVHDQEKKEEGGRRQANCSLEPVLGAQTEPDQELP